MLFGSEWIPNPAIALMRQWLEIWQRTLTLCGDTDGIALFWNPRQLRNQWLADLSQTMDNYMRSPAFLELIRYNLRAMTRTARPFSGGDAGLLRSDRV